MDGNCSARLTLVALCCASVLLAACSTGQPEANGGVVGLESTTSTVTTRTVIGQDRDPDDLPASSNDESLLVSTTNPGQNGTEKEGAPSTADQNTGSTPSTTTSTDKDATTMGSTTSGNATSVDQDDLVACANVERGYLLLLDGEPVQASPFLEKGASHSLSSLNPAYSNAAAILSDAVQLGNGAGDEVPQSADAFLMVCAADGFERLA